MDATFVMGILLFRCKYYGVYCLGFVAPGNGVLSWQTVLTTFRYQIHTLCQYTWKLSKKWRSKDDTDYEPLPRYSDSYGMITVLRVPHHIMWTPYTAIRECPHCFASWPSFQWAWATEQSLHADRENVYGKYVSFCYRDCPARSYTPCPRSMHSFLKKSEAPPWICRVYKPPVSSANTD